MNWLKYGSKEMLRPGVRMSSRETAKPSGFESLPRLVLFFKKIKGKLFFLK